MQFNFPTILIFAGALGLAAFLGLRPVIDFHGTVSVDPSHTNIEEQTSELLSYFDVSADTLTYFSLYEQREEIYRNYKNQGNSEKPGIMNRSGYPLTGWSVGAVEGRISSFGDFTYINELRQEHAVATVDYSSTHKVYALQANSALQHQMPFDEWVTGQADVFIADYLGYRDSNFSLDSVRTQAETIAFDEWEPADNLHEVSLIWTNQRDIVGQPIQLLLDIELQDNQWALSSVFASYFDGDRHLHTPIDQPELSEVTLIYTLIFVLGLLILGTGFRNIFKGQVEWFRIIILVVVFAVITFVSNFYFFYGMKSTLQADSFAILIFNNALNALLLSLIVAMAYISWEAFARQQNHLQLEVVDNIWQGRFFTKSTGEAIIQGYFSGGVLLGILALTLYATDGYYLLYNFTSLGTSFSSGAFNPLAIISMSLSNSIFYMLCTVVIIGSILSNFISREYLYFLLAVPILTLVYTSINWATISLGVDELWVKAIASALIVATSVFIFRYVGFASLLISWSVVGVVVFVMALWGAEDTALLRTTWITLGILGFPFLFGLIARVQGAESDEYKAYKPDYEEELARRSRYEKEIQIAHDSQLTLMPSTEPKVKGLDVKGFFIPSLEVGGDYFDYDVIETEGEPTLFKVAVVDVSGKGMQAAITAVFTSGLLLSRMMTDQAHFAMSKVNAILKEKTHPQTFITCLLAEYDLSTKALSFTNAGNSQPVLKRGNEVTLLDSDGPRLPLGVRECVDYQARQIELKPGDVLLFYSDGLPEARAANGNFLGYDYIRKLIKWMDTSNLTAAEMCSIIRKKILEFSNYELADDITVVVMKVEE